jgi:hypothetical protein
MNNPEIRELRKENIMKSLIINMQDAVFPKVVSLLKSFPKDQLEIIDNSPAQDDLRAFAEDLRHAFIEIKEIESGKRQAETWEDVKDAL